MIFFLFIICLVASVLLTYLVRRHAIAKARFDMPNHRSSHTIPTPSGGGLAFVIVFLLATLALFFSHDVPLLLMLALVGGGVIVAAVGFCDDRKPVSARWRFLVQLMAALWALYWLGGFPVLDFGVIQITALIVGSMLAIIAIIWSINLYNFMDGIDGLAGGQGVFLSIVAAIFFYINGDMALALLSSALAAAIAGFLYWNWPPAKIFMGDVGSGFLGFVFIVLAINACNKHEVSLVICLVLFALFLYDATFTLLYRVIKKQKYYQAHREHAYQQGVDAGWSHQKMTALYMIINAILLLPVVYLIYTKPHLSCWLWSIVSVILLLLWVAARRFKSVKDRHV